ncbi:hypothetical protein QMZ05_09830 [Bradyrhizobium sp. INPA03-11B]|uniref:hypothetical protein n=1 Tax=Bradyrhizobium sp. INPA03-11B TaxID=418598 RepID=UPI00338DB5AC
MQTPSKIDFFVCIALQGPILPGDYSVGDANINVSYPERVDFGFQAPIELPKGCSTLFKVSWTDTDGRTEAHLKSKSFHRNLPIYQALDLISRLFTAFMLEGSGEFGADG